MKTHILKKNLKKKDLTEIIFLRMIGQNENEYMDF